MGAESAREKVRGVRWGEGKRSALARRRAESAGEKGRGVCWREGARSPLARWRAESSSEMARGVRWLDGARSPLARWRVESSGEMACGVRWRDGRGVRWRRKISPSMKTAEFERQEATVAKKKERQRENGCQR
ncbi:hypothetical protein ACLB2K_019032 [Fragaria x ananassa]